jgi:DNA-directed RNA polymerase I subunit RPA1
LEVTERTGGGSTNAHEKVYDINIKFYDPSEYEEEYAITREDVLRCLQTKFLRRLDKLIKDELKKKEREATLSETTAAVPDVGASVGRIEEARPTGTRTSEREGGEDDIDEDADPDDAKDSAARRRREDTYDEPDEEENAIVNEDTDDAAGSDDDEESPSKKASNVTKKQPQNLREQNPDDSETAEEEPDSEAEARENQLKTEFPHLQRFSFAKNKGKKCRIILAYDSNMAKLLLLPILEKCAHDVVIQNIPGLGVCTQFMEEVQGPDGKPARAVNPETGLEETVKEAAITTEGVNLLAMRDYQHIINPHSIYTNSVHDMLRLYGVEAARMTVVKEIDGVFKGHGISVDIRHLNLIADAMTQSGSYMPFSRHGLVKEGGSVLAKMSFETVMGFLKDAALYGESDPLLGPSARIVAGRRGNIGTGSFDVVMPVH